MWLFSIAMWQALQQNFERVRKKLDSCTANEIHLREQIGENLSNPCKLHKGKPVKTTQPAVPIAGATLQVIHARIEYIQVLVLAATAKEFRGRSKPIETSQYRKCTPKEDAECSQLHENNSINQPWERMRNKQ